MSTTTSGVAPAATSGTRNVDPAAARTVFGPYGSVLSLAKTTPAAPTASAVRTIVPALPGSLIASSTMIRPRAPLASNESRVVVGPRRDRHDALRRCRCRPPWPRTPSANRWTAVDSAKPSSNDANRRRRRLVDEDGVDGEPGSEGFFDEGWALEHELAGLRTRPAAPDQAPQVLNVRVAQRQRRLVAGHRVIRRSRPPEWRHRPVR